MAKFEIIVGSVLGATEYVADALQEVLHSQSHQAEVHLTPTLADLDNQAIWLVCTSTHGAGDLPDNIQPLYEQLKNQNLTNCSFLVVGLGDSSYDTFCQGSIKMQEYLVNAGATLLNPPLHIDVLHHPIPEDVAVEWLTHYLNQVNHC
ncbi:FMN-binding protein MioC [Paraglaciecola aestuariivivens]